MASGSFLVAILSLFLLDLIAFGLGIGAEQRRATGTYQTDDNHTIQWCLYTSDIASGLAVGALLFLSTGQVILVVATRCLCCGSPLKPGAARAFAIIFFAFNWISFIIAGSCYLAGAVQNAKHIRYLSQFTSESYTCAAIRKGTFAAGVAFTFFSFVFSVAYYLCVTKAQEGSRNQFNKDSGVNMAAYH